MLGLKPANGHGIAGESADGQEGPGLDAVAHDLVRDRAELGDPLDFDDGRAGTADLGTHLVQQVGEVNDLRLASRIVDGGDALGEDRRHHEVLGGTDARKGERDGLALEAVRGARVDVAVVDLELDPERLEAEDVHVDLARADVAAARHGDDRLAKAGEQRP